MYRAYFQTPRVARRFMLSLRCIEGVQMAWSINHNGVKISWWLPE